MSKKEIYRSKLWKIITKQVWIKQCCLCNRCHRAVYVDGITEYLPKEKRLEGIVHHKQYLTDDNYTDVDIAYNEDNLEGICIDCHNREHFGNKILRDDVMFDEHGNLVRSWKSP